MPAFPLVLVVQNQFLVKARSLWHSDGINRPGRSWTVMVSICWLPSKMISQWSSCCILSSFRISSVTSHFLNSPQQIHSLLFSECSANAIFLNIPVGLIWSSLSSLSSCVYCFVVGDLAGSKVQWTSFFRRFSFSSTPPVHPPTLDSSSRFSRRYSQL